MLKNWPGILNTPLPPPFQCWVMQTDSNTIVDAARDAAANDRSTLRWGERGAPMLLAFVVNIGMLKWLLEGDD